MIMGGFNSRSHPMQKPPNRYRFVVPQNGKQYVQGFDGNSVWKMGWLQKRDDTHFINGQGCPGYGKRAGVELEDALIDYRNKGHLAVLLGKDTVKGKSCFKVKFTRKMGTRIPAILKIKTLPW